MFARPLEDRYGRVATDLHVSLTDRCNLRCNYCMPAEGVYWLPDDSMLTDDEIVRLMGIGVEHLGIREVRFTGGEPLVRRGLLDIVERTRPGTVGAIASVTRPFCGDCDRVRLTADGEVLSGLPILISKRGLPMMIGTARKRFRGEQSTYGTRPDRGRDLTAVTSALTTVDGAANLRVNDVVATRRAVPVAGAWQKGPHVHPK